MFWYKASASSTTEGAIISNKYWVSGGNTGFTIGDMKTGVTANLNTPGCSRKDTTRYAQATDDTWHHVAVSVDRTDKKTMIIYIDGAQMQSVNISALKGSADVADFLLGASNKAGSDVKFLAVDDSMKI